MIKAGIIGGTGYAAGELLRLLVHHPETEIQFVYSTSKAGKAITSVHTDLIGDIDAPFSSEVDSNIDVLFLCMGHGNSRNFLNENSIPEKVPIIDLSRDFRIAPDQSYGSRTFVYGLPELHKEAIKEAHNIANPGCFATSLQMTLLPLAKAGLLNNDVHLNGITGSTGAGSSLSPTTHFSWRSGNVSIYKPLQHQHIGEIRQKLQELDPDFDRELNFIPMRGDFTRGIFISAYTDFDKTEEEAKKIFQQFYEDAAYVHISDPPLNLKQAVNTNKCLLHLQKQDGKLLVTSILDNLLKGASGQAVQNMNLMFGFEETTGLQLKPSHF